ncbi:MAG: glycosyltransferase family 9 protein [Phycisphaerae bacterium]|nr:glycosyltransferase family 9 protein [Phycisphaerae bacterium]
MAHSVEAMNPSSILILHGGALGDFVLAVHFAAALREHWNVQHVAMWARSGLLVWMEGVHPIDEVARLGVLTPFLYRDDERSVSERRRAISRFEAIVSLFGGAAEPVVRPLARACRGNIYGIDPRPRTDGPLAGKHITEQWLHQVGIESAGTAPTSALCDIDTETRQGWFVNLRRRLRLGESRPVALCHPGSGSLKKCIRIEQWKVLIAALRECDFDVAWMIGPDERERMPTSWHRELASAAPVLYEEELPAAAELVAGCDLYIGLDAGMTHVAAMTGVKTVALFGPTDPNVWRPLGRDVRVVRFSEKNRDEDLAYRVMVAV